MKISWIVHARLTRGEDGSLTSDQASMRYRVLTPIQEMRGAFAHRLVPLSPQTPAQNLRDALDADILVFSKVFHDFEVGLAREAQAGGAKVIFDVCDDHFQSPELGGCYRALAGLADEVVCNSPQMAAAVAPYARQPATVIEDPYEGPRGEPRFAPGEVLKLLWFGHPTNLDTLEAALGDLTAYARRRPLALTVLTSPSGDLTTWLRAIGDAAPAGFAMEARSWSLAAQWDALAACDAVVIPTLDTARSRSKSANRMVEALWAGRPVAAQPLPAYAPFADWTPVRAALSEGLAQIAEHPARTLQLIGEAQREIAAAYDPARLAQRWAETLRAKAAAQETAT